MAFGSEGQRVSAVFDEPKTLISSSRGLLRVSGEGPRKRGLPSGRRRRASVGRAGLPVTPREIGCAFRWSPTRTARFWWGRPARQSRCLQRRYRVLGFGEPPWFPWRWVKAQDQSKAQGSIERCTCGNTGVQQRIARRSSLEAAVLRNEQQEGRVQVTGTPLSSREKLRRVSRL